MNTVNARRLGLCLLFWASLAPPVIVLAADEWSRAEPVDGATLEAMRGGFASDEGLKISFGVERLVSVNGEVLAATRFGLPQGTLPGNAAFSGGAFVLQNGMANAAQAGLLAQTAAATIIQNSLDNQQIQSLTVINVATNSMDFLKGINLQGVLADALARPVGVR